MDAGKRHQYIATMKKLKEILAAQCLDIAVSGADHQFYESARRELLADPELRPLLPQFLSDCHILRDFWGFIHSHVGVVKHSMVSQPEKVEFARKAFLPALDAMEHDRIPVTADTQAFLRPQSPHDGFVVVRDVLSAATASVLLADNWVDATLLPLLTNLRCGMTVRILTAQRNLPKDFLAECKKFEAQYGIPIQVRTTKDLHDRFVVIDGSRCVHFGASLKDLGTRAALMSHVTEPAISRAIVVALEDTWAKSSAAQ